MNKKYSSICCAFVLPTLMVFVLQSFRGIPIWALVIGWACFFHLNAGNNPIQSAIELLTNSILGVFVGWISALLILNNPFQLSLMESELWAPLVIGLSIASITTLNSFKLMSVTPVVIYGFALNWAFLSSPGMLDINHLTSIGFKNSLIAVSLAIFLGAIFGCINLLAINLLTLKNNSLTEKSI